MQRLRTIAASAACILTLPAIAGLPAAADRVPANALVTVAVDDLQDFHSQFLALTTKLGLPADAEPLQMMEMLLSADGLNKDGSAALVVLPDPQGDVELVILAPVDNFNNFVSGFGGQPGDMSTFEIEGETVVAKNIGGGYALLAPREGVFELYGDANDMMDTHMAAVGETGKRLADRADLVLLANIPALAPQIREGIADMKEQAGMFAAMAGDADQVQAQLKMVEMVGEWFLRDAQMSLLGLDLDESGVTLDLATQFKEGSEIAGFFNASGESGKLMGHVPEMDYLFAGAFDASPQGIRTIMNNFIAMSKELGVEQAAGMDFTQFIADSDGFAGVMGKTPALLAGGLFSNTVTFFRSDDAPAFAETFKGAYTAMNGMSQQGVTYNTSFDAGSVEVDGANADAWAVGMDIDPNNPNAFAMQQSMMMMFGPEMRMAGYGLATDKGYVQTMSQNKVLMAQAMEAAKQGDGLADNDRVRAMARRLPRARTGELYIGMDTLFGYARQVMAMMGGPGANLDVPDNLQPITVGMTTDNGGFRAITIVPMDVLETISQLTGGAQGAEPQPAGNPRF